MSETSEALSWKGSYAYEKARADVLEKALREARAALDRDRTWLASGLNRARDTAKGYSWIPAGEWGCYDYTEQTEQTLRMEVGTALAQIERDAHAALNASGTLATESIRAIDAALARYPAADHAKIQEGR